MGVITNGLPWRLKDVCRASSGSTFNGQSFPARLSTNKRFSPVVVSNRPNSAFDEKENVSKTSAISFNTTLEKMLNRHDMDAEMQTPHLLGAYLGASLATVDCEIADSSDAISIRRQQVQNEMRLIYLIPQRNFVP
jgi:hypothetical protein